MFSQNERNSLRDLIESLKRYNRYDLKDRSNKSILNDIYVDPLPDEGVLNAALNENTCFFIGRKGTGKSTVFMVAQERLRQTTDKIAVYIDVKSIFGATELTKLEVRKYSEELGADAIDNLKKYLIHKAFLKQFLTELTKEITDYLQLGIKDLFFSDRSAKITATIKWLNEWTEKILNTDTYRDIPLFREVKRVDKDQSKQQKEANASVEINGDSSFSLAKFANKLGFGIKGKYSRINAEETSQELTTEFKEILTLYFDVKTLMIDVSNMLKDAGFNKTFIFLDDFSEVEDEESARMIVDVLLAPLNNWSNDFYKFKVAAYPGRVYYGAIDKQKIDEVPLDFYDMYASKKLSELEQKAIDFTRRIFETRTNIYLSQNLSYYIDPVLWPNFYEELFKAAMNNPRRMGYILLNCYNSQIVHGHRITVTSLKEATILQYTQKDESFFRDNVKIQQAFGDRLLVQSQRELLNAIQGRAKDLSKELIKGGSEFFKKLPQLYTSHFFVLKEFEFLLSTLEHNFLISKYHEMKDRDGKEVTVYALNYGLCQKEGINFGRPEKTEEGKYYTERAFNYLPVIREFLSKFITIKCTNPDCKITYPTEQLQALKMYNMLCPTCLKAKCEMTLGYQKLVEEINSRYKDIQLPEYEFEILKVINDSVDEDWYASNIASEIDRSYQFVTKHADKLVDSLLLRKARKQVGDQERNCYTITKDAQERYFGYQEIEV